MRVEQRDSVGLNGGVRRVGDKPAEDDRPTLSQQGIDKNLAHQARTLGGLSDDRFEAVVADAEAGGASSAPPAEHAVGLQRANGVPAGEHTADCGGARGVAPHACVGAGAHTRYRLTRRRAAA